MPEDFRGPHLKLERAKHHIDDLHALLQKFMSAQSYKIVSQPVVYEKAAPLG
jgi:hypothetical protein